MCGIFGLIGEISESALKSANATISHRGPDADGFWTDPRESVHFCHRRLSILDLSAAGAQPMISRSGRFVTSYNGEIYNCQDLVSELNPVPWRGHSDTEVLLECLDQWGLEKTLKRIEGMYGAAVWDREERNLILFRDRMGEKPMYYGRVQGRFVFASELKPIISLFKNELQLNHEAVADFFRRSCIAGEKTIFRQIHKLPAGHYIVISNPRDPATPLPAPTQYWSVKDLKLGSLKVSDDEAIRLVEMDLRKAVGQQMVADVPLGAFLSGGIDSSLVVATMQKLSRRKVKTFSIGFESTGFNEAPYAKAVADNLGTEHYDLYVGESELLSQIPNLASVYDEPFADSSQIPTILVSKMARQYVTVALSGDGGDELFAGYNRHQFAQGQWKKIKNIPLPLRQLVSSSLTTLPPHAWQKIFGVIGVNASQPEAKVAKLAQSLNAKSLKELYMSVSTHWRNPSPMRNKDYALSEKDWDIDNALEMTRADANWYLPDDVLVKVDRAAMSRSLETRAPFLNRNLVETAFGLPLDQKIRNGQGKWILRQILYKDVPAELIERPKMGFGVPMEKWLKGELKEWAWDLLRPENLHQQDILDADIIQRKWNEHQSGMKDNFTELWDVLMFLSWRKHYRV